MISLDLITHEPSLIIQIGLILILATLIALIARLLKQPIIPAYIAVGLILGPIGFGLIQDQEIIRSISELGIAFLLFVVGLEINIKRLKYVGLVASVGGVIQVVAIYILSLLIATELGFPFFESIIIGLVMAFSSTMLVIKLLADSEKLDTLHGKIILGILLIQDLIVIIAMALLSTVGDLQISTVALAILKGVGLFAMAFLLGKYVLPSVFNFAARTKELLFLTSLTTLFIFAILAHILDFSIAIGAFIAGLAIAGLPYNLDVEGRVKPLKDFFATLFFVSLGMQLTLTFPQGLLLKAAILLGVVIIAKPIIIMLTTSLFGYEKRISFLTGSNLGQLSEFSLILVTLPFVFDKISQELFSMVILLTIVTMLLTSYTYEFSNAFYRIFSPFLKILDLLRIKKKKLEYLRKHSNKEILLAGKHRMGSILYEELKRVKKRIIVIDHNPEVIRKMINNQQACIYGDIHNTEILDKAGLKRIKIIISTIPHEDDNLFLLAYTKSVNPRIKVFVTAGHLHQAAKLYAQGADYVILPHLLSGERVSSLLRKTLKDKSYVKSLGREHKKYLRYILKKGIATNHDRSNTKINKKKAKKIAKKTAKMRKKFKKKKKKR